LNRLLGRPLGAPLATADSLDVPPALPDLLTLVGAAQRNRPELKSLQSQREGAHATTQLAREFWYPDLFAGLSRDFLADPSPGYLTTGVSLPIPLFYWNHSKGEIAAARFHEDELSASYRDTEAAVGQDVRVAYSAASTSLRQAIYIRDQLLPATRQAYRIASASYGLGGSSQLEVNAARVALLDAESQYTDALAAANSARAELERAVATPLTTLGTGAPR
jgi:cobalt-zinc-cadmium efflux system outer membrane protein